MVEIEMMPITTTTDKTLAMRMAEGRLPLGDALRVALEVGESLRRIHDSGRCHGAVTPSQILLTDGGAVLQTAINPAAATTPYSAPETREGRPADARSDIFSFGAVLYEMLTGRTFDDGTTADGAAAGLSGSPAADRVLALCLSANPDSRTQRMQTLLMELKLFGVTARRAEMASAAASRREAVVSSSEIRSEMREIEQRLEARLSAQERAVEEIQHSTIQAVTFLKEQIEGLRGELASAQASLAAEVSEIGQTMKTQSAAIEGARSAMGQMDDLVERVVEALETLQSAVLDPGDAHAGGSSLAAN